MDAETLERLLMDRALGGLGPDAEALLADYLAHNADARRRADEFDRAAAAARSVLRRSSPTTLPPFPATRIRRIEHARRQLAWVRAVAGVAAALVVGIGIGVAIAGRGPERGIATEPPNPPVIALVEPPAARAGVSEFWSVSRLVEKWRGSKRTESTGLIWNSAVKRPRLGDES